MTVPFGDPGPGRAQGEAHETPDDLPTTRAARQWVHHYARTLKTCRLYEQKGNATVERFIVELVALLHRFHEDHGALTLTFTSDDVRLDEESLYLARSREDNLAWPFYRDGIRSLTLRPGITKDEIEALTKAILDVTAPAPTEDDLVTRLWESHIDHVDVEYVPAEGDLGDSLEEEEPLPWPEPEDPGATPEPVEPGADPAPGRSDDWTVRDLTTEVEAGFTELEQIAAAETQRFHAEYQAEHQVPLPEAAIAVVQAYLEAGGDTLETADLGRFLPRVLRESLEAGRWLVAAECVALLARHGHDQWSRDTFVQELMQPIALAGVGACLDAQETEAATDFIEFTRSLGEPQVDVLLAAISQSESRRNRRLMTEVVVQRCRDNPERLAPWLADPRWFVVRNIVNILGAIGGAEVVGLLEAVSRHPEPRVRYAVVAALGQSPARAARIPLLAMLADADTRTFCSALQVLASERDPGLATCMLGLLHEPSFERRPGAEQRAIFQAVAATGDDAVVPELESELHKGNWFSNGREEHRLSIARCLARIGTTRAIEALERGAQSRRGPVRKACEEALLGWNPQA